MNMNKKKVLSLSIVVIMIAILSFSSLAWFSDSDTVQNDFNISGGDDATPEDIFSMDVEENIDTDGDGIADETISEGEDAEGEQYDAILPGDVLVKEPFATNNGSYDMYIRFQVTFNDLSVWSEILEPYGLSLLDMLELADGTKLVNDTEDWDFDINDTVVDAQNNTITYRFYFKGILQPDQSVTLFERVRIPAQLNQNDMAKFFGNFNIVVTADAVQTENLGADVDTAREAFAVVEGDQTLDQIG